MIARASERFPDIRLQQGDFLRKKLPVCDYVLASGSLNYGQDIFPAITKLFKSCKLGLGFNLLREVSEGLLQAHDPNEVLALAKKLSNNVILKGDYSPEDFTLFLYH